MFPRLTDAQARALPRDDPMREHCRVAMASSRAARLLPAWWRSRTMDLLFGSPSRRGLSLAGSQRPEPLALLGEPVHRPPRALQAPMN